MKNIKYLILSISSLLILVFGYLVINPEFNNHIINSKIENLSANYDKIELENKNISEKLDELEAENKKLKVENDNLKLEKESMTENTIDSTNSSEESYNSKKDEVNKSIEKTTGISDSAEKFTNFFLIVAVLLVLFLMFIVSI